MSERSVVMYLGKINNRRFTESSRTISAEMHPNKHEVNALAAASSSGGEYIESIAKTDLTTFTQAEWLTLIDVLITAFQDHLRNAYADDPPF